MSINVRFQYLSQKPPVAVDVKENKSWTKGTFRAFKVNCKTRDLCARSPTIKKGKKKACEQSSLHENRVESKRISTIWEVVFHFQRKIFFQKKKNMKKRKLIPLSQWKKEKFFFLTMKKCLFIAIVLVKKKSASLFLVVDV